MKRIQVLTSMAVRLTLLCTAFIAAGAQAAQADLSSTPLTAVAAAQVKPNVMLLMDTSGSMGWSHMPDEIESVAGVNSIGYKSAQCNVLYYNPNTVYVLPRKPDGALFPVPSFTNAPYAGYWSYFVAPDQVDSSSVDLSKSFRAYDGKTLRLTTTTPDSAQAAYYYTYSGPQTPNYALAPCTDPDGGGPGNGVTNATGGGTWTRTLVTGDTQQANFAIWYSFYRTRMALIKSAASLAFTPLTDSFRVGFITMQPTKADASVNPTKYVPISDFTSDHRAAWFSKLFSQVQGGASPAREGLARVGRHYGNKHDSINTGMDGDPMQYSCQQNFTIMTTDGYWNAQTETPGGGPLQLDGKTLVGQQDGSLTGPEGNTPRPIYDGLADTTVTKEDYEINYSYADCGSFAYRSTSQNLAKTTQTVQSTDQVFQHTEQIQRSTSQALANTTQNLQSTSQPTQSLVQHLLNTAQRLQSTFQRLQTTTQPTVSTSQVKFDTIQNLQSTTQNLQNTLQAIATTTRPTQSVTIDYVSTSRVLQSTQQVLQSTTQNLQTSQQNLASTVQYKQSTVQNLQSTAQLTKTTQQNLQSSLQQLQSTSQVFQTTTQTTRATTQATTNTTQVFQSTTQRTAATQQTKKSTLRTTQIDDNNETRSYVAPGKCVPGNNIRCVEESTPPTLVPRASCISASPDANGYYVTCDTTPLSAASGTPSCTDSPGTASNGYVETVCADVNTTPTAVQNCVSTPAAANNNWTNTFCSQNTSAATPVASCTPLAATSDNNWTATNCGLNVTGPTPDSACKPSSAAYPDWIETKCSSSTTAEAAVATCTASTTVTCRPVVTTDVPVADCVATGPEFSNGYVTTSCRNSPASPTPTPVQSCIPTAPSASNSFVTTVCTIDAQGPAGVQTCASEAPSASNAWLTTSCTQNNNANVPVLSCSAATASASNGWTTTTCPPARIQNDVAVPTCVAGAATSDNNFVLTTCAESDTTPTAVPNCAASGGSAPDWIATICTSKSTTAAVQSCAAAAPVAPDYITTSCAVSNVGPTGVASCTPSGPSAPSWIMTSCAPNDTSNVPVPTCSGGPADASNGYTATTCTANDTAPTPVDTCVPTAASSSNGYTATICSTTVVSGPTVVGSCTPVAPTASNGYRRTTCGTQVTITPMNCTPSADTTCSYISTGPTPVQTCVPATPDASNDFTGTSCSTNNTSNVPIPDTCVASAATEGNGWVTTSCPTPVTTGPMATPSCIAEAALPGNSYVSKRCTTILTGPAPTQACTGSGPTPSNDWTTTTCGSNDAINVGVQTCTASGPTSGNGWVTTTCPPPAVSTNVAVQTCSESLPNADNKWVATTCRDNNTGPAGVSSCAPVAPSASNSWTETFCTDNITNPVGVASCTPVPAADGNSWTQTVCDTKVDLNRPVQTCAASNPTDDNAYVTTTCSVNAARDKPVPSCTAQPASANNKWTTTTCSAAVTTGPTPVESCTAVDANDDNRFTATTCKTASSTPQAVQTCTPVDATVGNGWIATKCEHNTIEKKPVDVCVAAGPTSSNSWTTTTCPPPTVNEAPVQSCQESSASNANSWTSTTCRVATTGPEGPIEDCTPSPATAANFWTTTTCSPNKDPASATRKSALGVTNTKATGNNKTALDASVGTAGKKIVYTISHSLTVDYYSNNIRIGGLPDINTVSDPVNAPGAVCSATPDPLPTPNPAPAGGTNGVPLPKPVAENNNCTQWPCTTTQHTAGSSNSLADVSQYYYVTDLRPEMADNVGGAGAGVGTGAEDDRLKTQHMTTFAIGLGVSGTLNYRSDYRSLGTTAGDFADIRAGRRAWPVWPDPTLYKYATPDDYDNPKSIDDFWHTAVNGRGQYFSAGNPASVVSGLSGALSQINARLSSGSGGGASNLQPVEGDNYVFIGSYTTGDWTGEVQASTFDVNTGAVSQTSVWAAQGLLDGLTKPSCDARNIFLIRPGASSPSLVNFTWDTQHCDASGNNVGSPEQGVLTTDEKAYFSVANIALLSQRPAMTDGTNNTNDQVTLAAGANLVNFLRGQRGLEGFESNQADKLYRTRRHVLGDVVDGQPVYVKGPSNTYADSGYGDFASANVARAKMVYVAANDGMLHAFHAGVDATDKLGGQEAWAIIPSAMLPNLYKLADNNYGNVHQYFVDGAPVVADVRGMAANSWRTMLVGGFNDGGKGYYAIDITDPAQPKAMWEFNFATACWDGNSTSATADCHMGLSFGKPIVTKIKFANYPEGRWVVLVSSGYNNVRGAGASGDGQGYLYILDANTGTIIDKIGTGAGDPTTPSNLAQLNAYVDDASVNNSALRAYGTDMLGNVWHFDVNDNEGAAKRDAFLLGQAKDRQNRPQPITTRPELAELNGKPMVFFGTGRLLGTTDIADTQMQSIYGIVDPLSYSSPVYPDLRNALKPMVLTTLGSDIGSGRTAACSTAKADETRCTSTSGWVLDLTDTGERVNVDMQLGLTTLVIGSNVPTGDVCAIGGHSWLNYLNFATGESNASFGDGTESAFVSEYLSQSLIVGVSVIRLKDGSFKTEIRTNEPSNLNPPLNDKTLPPPGKRISWREIAQ